MMTLDDIIKALNANLVEIRKAAEVYEQCKVDFKTAADISDHKGMDKQREICHVATDQILDIIASSSMFVALSKTLK